MSDVEDNNDGLHEDESDGEGNEDEEDTRTQEEREEDEDNEEIEEYITAQPSVKVGGKTYDRRTVTEIEVKGGVTEIENHIFDSCKELSSIKLPSTLLSIGQLSFYRCKSLRSIKLPASLTNISGGAFCRSSLRSIVIPNSVTTLGNQVFVFCKFLTSVTLPNSISSIKDCTFFDCLSLESIVLPASIASIGSLAFYNCSALRSVIIPISTTVDATAFNRCTKLEAKSSSYNMTIVEYFRDYYHERVKLRVSALNCLKSINEARIRRGEEEVKRMKLSSSSSNSNVVAIGGESSSSIDGSNDMVLEGIVPSILAIINKKDNEIEVLKREKEEAKREILALRNNNENSAARNNLYLDGVLAESMITAEELWREILKFL